VFGQINVMKFNDTSDSGGIGPLNPKCRKLGIQLRFSDFPVRKEFTVSTVPVCWIGGFVLIKNLCFNIWT